MAYLGSTPEYQSFTSGTDYFNGDGISVAFTLSRPVASVNDIEVVISNVVQQPSTAYTVSGSTITFTSAPPAGTSNVYARYMSTATQTITPSPGTVGTSQISPSLTNVPFFGGSTIGAGNATGMKNRLINGGMVLDQRNAGASVTPSNTNYTLDRWYCTLSQASKFSVQQNAGAVTPVGFPNYLGCTSLSAYALSSAEQFTVRQAIEGHNVADLGWGTANAKTVTLSFLVRSSLTGTFGGALKNSAADRSYPFSYTVSSANTWEQKSITVVGDTTGTWQATTSTGIMLVFSLGTGSTGSGTAGAWAAANYSSATGATSVVATSGATFYVTGVQLEEGNAATSFEFRPYGTELALAQRYFQKWDGAPSRRWAFNGMILGTGDSYGVYFLKTIMRANPVLVTSGTASDYCLYAGNALFTCSTVPTITNGSVEAPQINFKASGMTDGRASMCGSNTDNGSLSFNSEL
tara:strand:- start:153 stop:1544 length:1392 start_codon:yes stop_codon:yes gene_type:complete